jgi:hypothetical protein
VHRFKRYARQKRFWIDRQDRRNGEIVFADVQAASETTALLMLSTGILKLASAVFWKMISIS